MSNILPLLPLALDAGSPHESDRAAVPETRAPASLPIPEAWLAPPQAPATRTKSAKAFLAVVLAVVLGLAVVDYFTPPAPYVAPTTTSEDGACPAP